MQNAMLDESQAGIISVIIDNNLGEISITSDVQIIDITLMAGGDESERESEKAGLKLNIQKMKIMAFSPITSWQIDRGKWKQWQNLFSWAPKSLRTVNATMK